ncbi:MAG: anaerobic ribonucleoside-triphosphate reductase activating protein [Actinomycetaceae bacterium]|nr:anaerobic ribonucleoside-triphosphate reductase activating protein [Actinomycetaceae bacterium]MDO4260405.1 anaerobic ribonucleoside-triphosphate reductase activating protein [Actinomycetaceae bacterium]
MTTTTTTADDLQIAGMVPLSTVDWPGRLAATLFCQGCPWACVYCHNHAILDPRTPGAVPWSDVENLLARRHGLLDAVVFSGGEATRQQALIPAARRVRDLGFAVGLHSAGIFPHRLEELLKQHLVDWIGLDIKALPGANYDEVTGQRPRLQQSAPPSSYRAGHLAWRSLEICLDHPEVDLEVRITVYPTGPRDALDVARRVRNMGVAHLAIQKARACGAPHDFVAHGPGWDEWCEALIPALADCGFDSLVLRS